MAKYAIGVDFGTLSGRALLVDVKTGDELATSVLDYPHSVMDEKLPSGKKLGADWALQDPRDYLDVLTTTIPDVIEKSGVSVDDIIGIGLDFTACTVMPVKRTVLRFALWISIRMSRTPMSSSGSITRLRLRQPSSTR